MAQTGSGQTGGVHGGPASNEPLLTRYLIFEASEDGVTLTRIGHQLARGSDEALRKFHADPLVDRDGLYVAISENAARLKHAEARVKTTISERDWPELADGQETLAL